MRTTARQMFYQETQGRKKPLSGEREDVGVHQTVGEGRVGSSHPHRESSMCQSLAAREGKALRRTCGRVSVAGMDGVWSSRQERWAKARCLSDLTFVAICTLSCVYISQWAPGAPRQELPVPRGHRQLVRRDPSWPLSGPEAERSKTRDKLWGSWGSQGHPKSMWNVHIISFLKICVCVDQF